MNKYKVVLLVLVGSLAMACTPKKGEPTPTPEVYTTPVVVIQETEAISNLEKPTRLDIIMQPVGDPERRCEDMGGTYKVLSDKLLCEDVDY